MPRSATTAWRRRTGRGNATVSGRWASEWQSHVPRSMACCGSTPIRVRTIPKKKVGNFGGGELSPLLAHLALHGLEHHSKEALPRRMQAPAVMRYADDLGVIHADPAVRDKCQDIISAQRTGRGLALQPSTTRIAQTRSKDAGEAGCDVLGFPSRPYPASKTQLGFKTILTPSKQAMKRHRRRRGAVIAHQPMATPAQLSTERGPVIGGWSNDAATVCRQRTDSKGERTLLPPRRAWRQGRPPKQARPWATAPSGKRAGGTRHFSPKKSRISRRFHRDTPIQRQGKLQGQRRP